MVAARFFANGRLPGYVEAAMHGGPGRFYEIEFEPRAALPLLEEPVTIPGFGAATVTRLATAPFADYFAFAAQDAFTQPHHVAQLVERCTSDAICFSGIIEGSAVDRVLSESGRGTWVAAQSTAGVDCSGAFATYIERTSRLVRRIHRRSEEMNGRVRFELERCEARDLTWLLELQGERAKSCGYDSIGEDRVVRTVLQRLVDAENVLVARYCIDDSPASGLLVFDEGTSWSVYLQGFAACHASASPSIANMVRLVREAYARGVSYVDLLRGQEAYKRMLTNTEVIMKKFVCVRNPRLPPTLFTSYVSEWKE